MNIPIIFLGTSQAIPTEKRNHTSILLTHKSENILIDCGEGTQRQFRKANLSPTKLTKILITHWHGDHVLGLPGLLQTLALNNYSKTLHIYGPKNTKYFMNQLYKIFVPRAKLKLEIHEVSGKFFENSDFSLTAFPLKHGVPCNAYVFEEKDKVRIHKSKIQKLNLSHEQLANLSKGKDIRFKNKTIKAKSLTYIQEGKKISFMFDTEKINAIKQINNSDLLITESTYTEKEKDLAKNYKHLTARQAAEIAKASKSKQLILTHISQRYDNKENLILQEAKKVFQKTKIAEDLMKVEV